MLRILCILFFCNFFCGEVVFYVYFRNLNYIFQEDYYYLCFIGYLEDIKRVIKVVI